MKKTNIVSVYELGNFIARETGRNSEETIRECYDLTGHEDGCSIATFEKDTLLDDDECDYMSFSLRYGMVLYMKTKKIYEFTLSAN
jgi:hypothetical protein